MRRNLAADKDMLANPETRKKGTDASCPVRRRILHAEAAQELYLERRGPSTVCPAVASLVWHVQASSRGWSHTWDGAQLEPVVGQATS